MIRSFASSLVVACALAAPAAAELIGEAFEYDVGGTTFEGYVARNTDLPETKGTVLIVHDWDGLTAYEQKRADMLAALGYTAVAIDVYGKENRPSTMDENRARSGALYADRALFRSRLEGSVTAAQALEGVGDGIVLAGYCFGGAATLEAARSGLALDGFVSFHGGLSTPEGQDYSMTQAPVLLLHGTADPVSGTADLAQVVGEMLDAGVEHDAQLFGGARHSFTVWGSNDYDLAADQQSWTAFLGFLEDRL
ncbi:dienelactone hydrolase family protein [Sulfitobacter sp. HNIBRBA3233]|uniref:dienelactone hydrolase family protein n=1 Tax=Sulfitobacter marinivivus TaxID=3158558 RepID=UPI0032DE50B4